ncbi:uncharacterized protein zmp:0000000951 [Esox lucius]|uniref:uncharacterized protein zmp:0000000951 n=1 Tax=Esox lucius TaxID=8010 RepID=UPI000577B410|nr:uncharacterized protein zmp:0000000951 [Esox lucius]
MTEKLSDEMVELLLAPWRSSSQVTGLEGRIVAALEMYDHFYLDVAVTGGTQDANNQLAKALCGLTDDKEEVEEGENEEAIDDVDCKKEWEGEVEHSRVTTLEKGKLVSKEKITVKASDDNNDSPTDNQPMVLHPTIPNIRIWSVSSLDGQNHPIDHYDVLVVLTSEQHQEDLPGPIMELRKRDQPMVLVRAKQEQDLVQEKITGPCKTCAWERMRDRKMEIERKRLSTRAGGDMKAKQTLLDLWEIGATMTASLPELRKEAFCQFMVEVVRENRVPKLLRNTKQSLLSAGLKIGKVRQEDVDCHGDLFQSMDLINPPSRLLSALTALEHLRLDLGVLGQTGSGCSSLVNSLLGLKNTDQGASPTGVTETTIDVLGFPYPELPNVWLWDLPGMGRVGDLVPNDDKLPSIQPPTLPLSLPLFPLHPPCDVYILVSPIRLSLESVQLLQILSAQGRSCYLVISKADLIDEVAVEEVRRWSEETLCRIGLKQTTFLVSALHIGDLDLPKLQEALRGALASHRRAAFARYVVESLKTKVWGGKNLGDLCKLQ